MARDSRSFISHLIVGMQKPCANCWQRAPIPDRLLAFHFLLRLSRRKPDVVARLTLEAMNSGSMEASLTRAFRTRLGLLDVPARRLAQACVSASRTWQASSASSNSASAGTQDGSDALTALIRQAFAAQTRVAHLPKEFVEVSRQIDLDLVDDFNNLV